MPPASLSPWSSLHRGQGRGGGTEDNAEEEGEQGWGRTPLSYPKTEGGGQENFRFCGPAKARCLAKTGQKSLQSPFKINPRTLTFENFEQFPRGKHQSIKKMCNTLKSEGKRQNHFAIFGTKDGVGGLDPLPTSKGGSGPPTLPPPGSSKLKGTAFQAREKIYKLLRPWIAAWYRAWSWGPSLADQRAAKGVKRLARGGGLVGAVGSYLLCRDWIGPPLTSGRPPLWT